MPLSDPHMVADLLKSFGFEPDPGVFSDYDLGMACEFGNFRLSASFVLSAHCAECILFTGTLRTPRSLSRVMFEIPQRNISRERLAAFIAYYLDKAAGRRFEPVRPSPWLDLGRENKHHLPWVKDQIEAAAKAAAQQRAWLARLHCDVEREWLKLALKSLAKQVAEAQDADPVRVSFDGRVLSFHCGGKDVVVAGTGDPWPEAFHLPAGRLRNLPKRLMSPLVDISIHEAKLRVDRWVYSGVEKTEDVFRLTSE